MEFLHDSNGRPLRVRNNSGKEYPLVFISNDLPKYHGRDDFDNLYLHSVGSRRLRFQGPSPTSEYYVAHIFKAQPPEIEEDCIAIARRKMPKLFFISEIWEIRGAARRLRLELV